MMIYDSIVLELDMRQKESEFQILESMLEDYEKQYMMQNVYQEGIGDERKEYRKSGESLIVSIFKFIGRLINNIIYRIRRLFDYKGKQADSKSLTTSNGNTKPEVTQTVEKTTEEIKEEVKQNPSVIDQYLESHKEDEFEEDGYEIEIVRESKYVSVTKKIKVVNASANTTFAVRLKDNVPKIIWVDNFDEDGYKTLLTYADNLITALAEMKKFESSLKTAKISLQGILQWNSKVEKIDGQIFDNKICFLDKQKKSEDVENFDKYDDLIKSTLTIMSKLEELHKQQNEMVQSLTSTNTSKNTDTQIKMIYETYRRCTGRLIKTINDYIAFFEKRGEPEFYLLKKVCNNGDAKKRTKNLSKDLEFTKDIQNMPNYKSLVKSNPKQTEVLEVQQNEAKKNPKQDVEQPKGGMIDNPEYKTDPVPKGNFKDEDLNKRRTTEELQNEAKKNPKQDVTENQTDLVRNEKDVQQTRKEAADRPHGASDIEEPEETVIRDTAVSRNGVKAQILYESNKPHYFCSAKINNAIMNLSGDGDISDKRYTIYIADGPNDTTIKKIIKDGGKFDAPTPNGLFILQSSSLVDIKNLFDKESTIIKYMRKASQKALDGNKSDLIKLCKFFGIKIDAQASPSTKLKDAKHEPEQMEDINTSNPKQDVKEETKTNMKDGQYSPKSFGNEVNKQYVEYCKKQIQNIPNIIPPDVIPPRAINQFNKMCDNFDEDNDSIEDFVEELRGWVEKYLQGSYNKLNPDDWEKIKDVMNNIGFKECKPIKPGVDLNSTISGYRKRTSFLFDRAIDVSTNDPNLNFKIKSIQLMPRYFHFIGDIGASEVVFVLGRCSYYRYKGQSQQSA